MPEKKRNHAKTFMKPQLALRKAGNIYWGGGLGLGPTGVITKKKLGVPKRMQNAKLFKKKLPIRGDRFLTQNMPWTTHFQAIFANFGPFTSLKTLGQLEMNE